MVTYSRFFLSLATAVCLADRSSAATFADSVVSYDPGTGYAIDFETGLGYTLEATALGQPNVLTPFGAVQPFNPQYTRDDLLSIGAGGHLIVRFDFPVWNDAANPFGIDFIVYGSAGFIDVDYPNGQTDALASMFGQNAGSTLVSVSADNVDYFRLDPSVAPTVDGLYPTDGSGQFGLPVDPELQAADFANRSLAEIRGLYAGSAGGTGYDLAWAVDAGGQRVSLGQAYYVRVDVLGGRSEIDGFAVVPEPGWPLWVAGVGVLAWAGWRRRRSRAMEAGFEGGVR